MNTHMTRRVSWDPSLRSPVAYLDGWEHPIDPGSDHWTALVRIELRLRRDRTWAHLASALIRARNVTGKAPSRLDDLAAVLDGKKGWTWAVNDMRKIAAEIRLAMKVQSKEGGTT